jgi:nucleotide-binding universal stress UspA family protein
MLPLQVPYHVDVVPDEGIALAAGALLRLEKAEEIEAAAVVVASQPQEPTHEFLMGSISNFLVHHCPQPVPAARTAQVYVCM